jgi:hypothetical protein
MSSAQTVPDDAKDEFWAVVKDCLREFHKMTNESTRRKAAQLRKEIESMTEGRIAYFYHSEPFDVACDIAKHPLKLEKHLDRYLQIRDETHGDGGLKQVLRRPSKQTN